MEQPKTTHHLESLVSSRLTEHPYDQAEWWVRRNFILHLLQEAKIEEEQAALITVEERSAQMSGATHIDSSESFYPAYYKAQLLQTPVLIQGKSREKLLILTSIGQSPEEDVTIAITQEGSIFVPQNQEGILFCVHNDFLQPLPGVVREYSSRAIPNKLERIKTEALALAIRPDYFRPTVYQTEPFDPQKITSIRTTVAPREELVKQVDNLTKSLTQRT